MNRSVTLFVIAALAIGLVLPARADELLYSYDGDVLPYDPAAGWEIFDPCEPPCEESLENGHFVLRWTAEPWADTARYNIFTEGPGEPPPPYWAEWQFRSNHPLVFNAVGCDAAMLLQYQGIVDRVHMTGDSAVAMSLGGYVLDLDMTEFHTFRFDCPDGANYTFSVDGQVFWTNFDDTGLIWSSLQMIGQGGCTHDNFQNGVNEWDFVRYGRHTSGEQIISVDPPPGVLITEPGAPLQRFTVTFDAPNFVFIDEIGVSVTGGTAPAIAATKRLENGAPEELQIVLDGQLPIGETTTFTFDTGTGPQTVAYTVLPPDIPASSEWGLAIMTLAGLSAGTILLRRRRRVPCRSH